jgi:hypothetical protein
MKQLNQIIAIEKGIKSRAYSIVTELRKVSLKSDLFNGFVKTYKKRDDEGEDFPQEKKKVQRNVNDHIDSFTKSLIEIVDITATKDWANCNAIADVVVNGVVLIKDAPTPFLLFLEKQVNDIRTFVEDLPVLDETEDWKEDVNSGQCKTEPIFTHKTKKMTKPITLAEATKEHPAQTQLISEDMVVGYWETIKYSGAISSRVKKSILDKIEDFSSAVKCAREKANSTEAQEQFFGNNIFQFIFSDLK